MATYNEYYNTFMNKSEEEIAISKEIDEENERFENLPIVKEHREKVDVLWKKEHEVLVKRLEKARELRPTRNRVKLSSEPKREKQKVEWSPELENAVKAVNALDHGDKVMLSRICFSERIPDGKNKVDDEVINELHHVLVQTVLDFINEKKLKGIWSVGFSADSLAESAECGYWTPATDSFLGLEGIEDVTYTDDNGVEHTISGRVNIGESY